MRKKEMKHLIAITVFVVFSAIQGRAVAETIQWHASNLQLLQGWDYELGAEQRTLLTLEHASGWKYGDLYAFADFEDREDGVYNYYAEFSPRISLGKVLGKDLSNGIIKDYLLSSTYEKGRNGVERFLIGAAVDLKLPGFKYFKVNLYNRNNPDRPDNTWQLTLGWKRLFVVGHTKFIIEGFADFYGEEGEQFKTSQLIVPRFLIDVGSFIGGVPESKLFAGIEWQYWHNKFGVDGVTENVPQLQMKFVF